VAPAFIVALVMLTAVLIIGIVVLSRDAQRKRLDRQLDLVAMTPREPTRESIQLPRVRLPSSSDYWWRGLIYFLFRYNRDAPRSW
jgi:hypothetical protein